MSLDVLAQHLASKGRNGDSMLVHMTPGEVHGLHALALAHGGKLTINPDTGLPEANFLKKLLPMVAGFALGPAGFGLMSSLGAAATVGGVTALATGSLTKGLVAGLGAYGGSSLGAGLMGAGEGAIGANALASEAGREAVASKIMEQNLAEEAARSAVAKEAVAGSSFLDKLVAGGKEVFAPGGLKALSAGMPAGSLSPKALALMSAAPLMADQAVPTVTKSPGETGYVRPFDYNTATFGQGPQGLQALAPIPANQISYGPPPGGANGGLVALARGGVPSVPDVNDPERREFEQRLASQMSPEEFEQLRKSPTSVLSPTFSADLAAHLQGQQELRQQGLTSVVGSPFEGGAWRAGTKLDSPEQAVSAYLNALTVERPFGGSQITGEKDLNTLFRSYINTALVDPNAAADTLAKMRALGFDPHAPNQAGMIEALDPEFESKIYYKYYDPNREDKKAVAPIQILYNRMAAGERNPWEVDVGPAPAPYSRQAPVVDSQTPATDYLTGRTPDTAAPAPAPAPDPRFETPYPEPTPAPAPAPAPVIKTPEATVTPGTVIGGGVTTPTTPTTPTFELPREEQIFKTPVGTITGGTVTGAVDTKEALREYERTAPTGKPPAITVDSVLGGYKGQDKTYGGVEKPYVMPTPAALGTAGSISRGTETMDDVRRLTGNRYDQAPSTFTPSISGASKSAYDFLMGKGAYPTDQFDRTEVGPVRPLWRPYVQGVAGAADAFAPRTAAPTAQFGFKPPTVGTPTTGTQRWKNTKTGEIYLAPAGYAPPSNDWVLDTQLTTIGSDSTTGGGEGVGGTSSPGESDGFGPGESAKAGGLMKLAMGGYAQGGYNLGSYSDGGRLLRGPGDGVSDDIPATIGDGQPARLADGEFVVPARIVSELGNGSTEAGARQLYAMMDRVQRARNRTVGKDQVAANTNAARFLPA